MKSFTTFLKKTGLVLGLAAFSVIALPTFDLGPLSSTAFAQQNRVVKERPKQNVAPQVTPAFFKIYEAIQVSMEENDHPKSVELINKIISGKSFNSYEKAIARQLRGQLYFEQDNFPGAIREFEAVLASPNIPYRFADSVQFTLAQFYTVEGNYKKALALLLDWMQYQPTLKSSQWHIVGQTYYQMGLEQGKTNQTRAKETFREGIPYIENAIDMALANPAKEVRENWYELQYVLYYELGNHAKVRDILEHMIVRWPRPRYWIQLSVMYSELNENEKQMAVMDVAYRLGFITAQTNLVSIAQLYMVSSPYLAAKVLEKGMDDDCGEVCIDNEDPKYQKLLGQAHLNSKDFIKAGDPLSLAAAEEETGELWFQLGIVFMQLENWTKAEDAFQKALKKGDLRQEGQTHIWLGTAFFNQEKFKKAEDIFKKARGFKSIRKNANGWIDYIGAEKARLRRLAAAGLRP